MERDVDYYKIYVDQLNDGKIEHLSRVFPSEIMDINDQELIFNSEVKVTGEAYQSESSLVLHMDLSTIATVPCSVCNEPVDVSVIIKNIYHVVPILEIKGHIFDMRDVVRENILLGSPNFAECNEGNCKQRASLKKYLANSKPIDDGQRPFKDLQ